MGFYGNITNTSNTTFSFDRIYPNRLAMDANANNDGIFIGRYVLVEYDNKATISNIFIDTTNVVKTQQENGVNVNYYYGYTTETFNDINTRIQYKPNNRGENKNLNVYFLGEFGQVQKTEGNQLQQEYYTEFYQCVDSIVSEQDSTIYYALFKYVTKSNTTDSEYIKNFAIDEAQYKEKKGYDSTVWTKASVKKPSGLLVTEYVRIADLNSVVPTFDLETDAPTMKPLVPHFDADSTNVYYKLHTQPQWGLRVAEVESGKISDSTTNWISSTYNPATGQLIPSEDNGEHDAAIYFNKAAFLPQIDVNRNTENGIDKKKEDSQEKNYFTINPTGTSHNQYYLHTALDENGNLQKIYGEANDIQEMRINLPAIGNMMSEAWDIIYGPKRDKARTDDNGSLQGRLDSFKVMEDNHIPIKRNDDGTIIGTAINGNNDYQMPNGKNILTTTHFPLTTNDPWINVTIDNSSLQGGYDKKNKTEISQENNNAIRIRHSANKVDPTITSWDKNGVETSINNSYDYYNIDTNINGEQDKIKLYVPYVDATGHVVGKNIETVTLPYGYKHFKTDGLSPKDIEGKDIVGDLYSTVNYTSTEDTKSTGDITNSSVAHNTQDVLTINPHNKWIQTKIEDTENDGDILTIAHEIHSIDERYDSNTNLNDLSIDNENEEGNLTIYDWGYDEAGHINKKREHTYTLPYGFKYIKTNGLAKENNLDITNKDLDDPKTETATANSTQDTFNIDTVNKWIQVEVTDNDNRIKIAHELHEITENVTTDTIDDLNNQKNNQVQNTINIPDWNFDNAGHITHKSDRIYTLPYGYKHVVVNNNGSSVIAEPGSTTGTQTADSTQGALTLDSSNKWIVLDKTNSNDIIKFGHLHSELSSGTHELKAQEPKFGKTFNIQTFTTDNAGHLIDKDVETVKIPEGKYEIDTPNTNSTSLIVGMKLDGPTGEITTTSATTNTLQLSNYTYIGNGTKDTQTVANGQSINTALGALEKRINDLDYADSGANTTQFVSKVTEEEGIINVERANVGGLVLTGYTAAGKGSGEVGETDTVNSAFAKIENKINTFLKAADTSINAIDTLRELQVYIEEHDVEATNIIKSINDEVTRATNAENANTSLINQEVSRAQSKENEIVNNLNNEISRAIEEEGKLNTRIDNLVGNTKVSTQIDNKINTFNSTLGSAAYTESTAYATAAQGATADRIATTIDATDIVDYQAEDFVSKEEYNALLEDYNELKDLVDKLNKQLNPDPETPVEGE